MAYSEIQFLDSAVQDSISSHSSGTNIKKSAAFTSLGVQCSRTDAAPHRGCSSCLQPEGPTASVNLRSTAHHF